jgi:hypothetical protein
MPNGFGWAIADAGATPTATVVSKNHRRKGRSIDLM